MLKPKPVVLSKSRIMRGLQCHKQLFFDLNRPELAEATSASEQARFDAGNEVGIEAQKQFPGGILIEAPYYDRELAVAQTTSAIASGQKVIYEASFKYNNLFAKIDILNLKKNSWELIEVKSSTKVKEEHYLDVAIQALILIRNGLPLKKCFLMHIHNQCRYPDLKDLFVLQDITDEVMQRLPEVESKIKKLIKITGSTVEPKINIGPHCSSPYECPYSKHCWKNIPEKSVFALPGMGKKAWSLFDEGYIKIEDLDPSNFKGKTKRAIEVTISNKRFVDKESIHAALADWKWPLYFLDFETIGYAIPRHKGTRPFSNIPFQFSCHVWSSHKTKKLEHFEYLHTDGTDPRDALAQSLIKNMGTTGSVVAYNMGFERSVLQSLAEHFPKYKKQLLAIAERLVDPLPIFQTSIYDAKFLGSFSIKAVAPVIVGEHLRYDKLEVSDGTEAGAIANQLMTDKISDPKAREKQIKALLEYCRQDTLAMVELVKWLYQQK